MTEDMNRVTAVIRLSGAVANLKIIESSVCESGARLVFRPPNVSPEMAPEAALVFEVALSDQESTEPAISQVLDQADAAVDEFAAVCAGGAFAVEVECIVHLYTDPPVYEVSAKTLKRVCALGACLGFDIYDSRPSDPAV
jgi:hypothetical protein